MNASETADVLRIGNTQVDSVLAFFQSQGLQIHWVAAGQTIPGSHWGDAEAGLIQQSLYLRPDTPVHSAMHEACHWLLMSAERRAQLHTNAGGTAIEENAVCFLQILLSSQVPDMGQERMFRDMDSWGYSFRLGSAKRWFAEDAEDALRFIESHAVAALEPVSHLLKQYPGSLAGNVH